jgi:hypothetical protein
MDDSAKSDPRLFRLTKQLVLACVANAAGGQSAYIGDQALREHKRWVSTGGKGFPPRSSLILARLRGLERDGLIKCVGGPDGYYGFTWHLTDAGRAALKQGGE